MWNVYSILKLKRMFAPKMHSNRRNSMHMNRNVILGFCCLFTRVSMAATITTSAINVLVFPHCSFYFSSYSVNKVNVLESVKKIIRIQYLSSLHVPSAMTYARMCHRISDLIRIILKLKFICFFQLLLSYSLVWWKTFFWIWSM